MTPSKFKITPDKFVKYEDIDDDFIINYFKTKRFLLNGQLLTYYVNKYEGRYDPNILKYLENRYNDSLSLKETVYRIIKHVEIRPVCKMCGGVVPMMQGSIDFPLFKDHCCGKCAANDPDVKSKLNTPESIAKANKAREEHWLEKTNGQYSNPSQLPEIKQKKADTIKLHFPDKNPMQVAIEEGRYNVKKVLEKIIETKRRNKSFKKSKEEDFVYKRLLTVFSKNDIIRQFVNDEYKGINNYFCDFYIKSLNLYIEYNGTWTHGGKPFDSNDENDLAKLSYWKKKAEKSNYYKNAVNTWTVKDVRKREICKERNLNFIELWNLDEVENFISSFETQKINNLSI